MIGKGIEPAFPPIVERRPNPYGPGIVVRRTVDIKRITQEMADPASVIGELAKDAGLPLNPDEKKPLYPGYL